MFLGFVKFVQLAWKYQIETAPFFVRYFLTFVFREPLIHQAGGDITKPIELRESLVRCLESCLLPPRKSQMLRTREATEPSI